MKLGAGVALFEGNNTYDGSTTVSAGTLLVSGSQPQSAISVDGGATIGGAGVVGAIKVANGTIAPGGSPGVLSSAGVVIAAGSAFVAEIDDTGPGAGYDQLNVTGAVTIADAILTLTARMLPPTDTFTIINNDGNDPWANGQANHAVAQDRDVDLQEQFHQEFVVRRAVYHDLP